MTTSTRGQSRRHVLRREGGCEALHGDHVHTGTNLEAEGAQGAAEHSVGTLVERSQRRNMAVTANKD